MLLSVLELAEWETFIFFIIVVMLSIFLFDYITCKRSIILKYFNSLLNTNYYHNTYDRKSLRLENNVESLYYGLSSCYHEKGYDFSSS